MGTQGSHIAKFSGHTPRMPPGSRVDAAVPAHCCLAHFPLSLPPGRAPGAGGTQSPSPASLQPIPAPKGKWELLEDIPAKSTPEANKPPLSGSVQMPCRLPVIIFTLECFHQPLRS